MKNNISFIPLGIGISALIIYIFNIINYKIVNNSTVMSQIIYNLRIYLYIFIICFIIYFMLRIIEILKLKNKNINSKNILKTKEINEVIIRGNKYCFNCGEKIFDSDIYCKNCGAYQKNAKQGINPFFKKMIKLLEIIILILILYFVTTLLFDYKEKVDHNFKSPFKVSLIKEK